MIALCVLKEVLFLHPVIKLVLAAMQVWVSERKNGVGTSLIWLLFFPENLMYLKSTQTDTNV